MPLLTSCLSPDFTSPSKHPPLLSSDAISRSTTKSRDGPVPPHQPIGNACGDPADGRNSSSSEGRGTGGESTQDGVERHLFPSPPATPAAPTPRAAASAPRDDDDFLSSSSRAAACLPGGATDGPHSATPAVPPINDGVGADVRASPGPRRRVGGYFGSRSITPFISLRGRAYAFIHSGGEESPASVGAGTHCGGGRRAGAIARFVAGFSAKLAALQQLQRQRWQWLRSTAGGYGSLESDTGIPQLDDGPNDVNAVNEAAEEFDEHLHVTNAEAALAARLPGVVWRHDPYSAVTFQYAPPAGNGKGEGQEGEGNGIAGAYATHRAVSSPSFPRDGAVDEQGEDGQLTAAAQRQRPHHHHRRRFVPALAGVAAGYYCCSSAPMPGLAQRAAAASTTPPPTYEYTAPAGDPPAPGPHPHRERPPTLPKASAAATTLSDTPVKPTGNSRLDRGGSEDGGATPSERPRPGIVRSFLITPNNKGESEGASHTRHRCCCGADGKTREGTSPATEASVTARSHHEKGTDTLAAAARPAAGRGGTTGKTADAAEEQREFRIPEPRYMREHRRPQGGEEATQPPNTPTSLTAAAKYTVKRTAHTAEREPRVTSWAAKLRHSTTTATRGESAGTGNRDEGDADTDTVVGAAAAAASQPYDDGGSTGRTIAPGGGGGDGDPATQQTGASAEEGCDFDRLWSLSESVYNSGLFSDASAQRQTRERAYAQYLRRNRYGCYDDRRGQGNKRRDEEYGGSAKSSRGITAAQMKAMRAPATDAKYYFVLQHRCRRSCAVGPDFYAPNTVVVVDGDMGVEMGLVASCVSEKAYRDYVAQHRVHLRHPRANDKDSHDPAAAAAVGDNEMLALDGTRIPRDADEAARALIYRLATPEEIVFYYEPLLELECGTLAFLEYVKEVVKRAARQRTVYYPCDRHGGKERDGNDSSDGNRNADAVEAEEAGRTTTANARTTSSRMPPWRHNLLSCLPGFLDSNVGYMTFLACEFQADAKKLYIYYQASRPVRFLGLATYLFHVFRCRIWFHEVTQDELSLAAA